MRRRVFLPLALLATTLVACLAPVAATPTPIPPAAAIYPTLTPLSQSPTVSPTTIIVPTVTLSPTPFSGLDAVTSAANVNLRTGPGYTFPVLRILKEGVSVTVLARSPGGEWYRVRTPERIEGWVFGWLLHADVDMQEAPIIRPENVQLIRGRVLDGGGTPIRGVTFSIRQGSGAAAKTNAVVTDAAGEFFSYLPPNSSGSWSVEHTGIACDSNVWADDNCASYANGYQGVVEPSSASITLPHPEVLEFTWK